MANPTVHVSFGHNGRHEVIVTDHHGTTKGPMELWDGDVFDIEVDLSPLEAAIARVRAYQNAYTVPETCCGTKEWRGHFCAYHTGYTDALDETEAALDEEGE